MEDIRDQHEPWHLGYFRFNAYEFGWLISGASRSAYLSLSGGGILEIDVRLTPEQARHFGLRKKIRYMTTIAPTRTWKTEAKALPVCFDVLPPRQGNMRYVDRGNAYASAKTGARCKGCQGQAREAMESLRRSLTNYQDNELANLEFESIASCLHQAWLEAWVYVPWMAGQELYALEFEAKAFGPPAHARSKMAPRDELIAEWRALLKRWDSCVETTSEKFERLEALAKWVGNSVREAEKNEWPGLDFSDEKGTKISKME